MAILTIQDLYNAAIFSRKFLAIACGKESAISKSLKEIFIESLDFRFGVCQIKVQIVQMSTTSAGIICLIVISCSVGISFHPNTGVIRIHIVFLHSEPHLKSCIH